MFLLKVVVLAGIAARRRPAAATTMRHPDVVRSVVMMQQQLLLRDGSSCCTVVLSRRRWSSQRSASPNLHSVYLSYFGILLGTVYIDYMFMSSYCTQGRDIHLNENNSFMGGHRDERMAVGGSHGGRLGRHRVTRTEG